MLSRDEELLRRQSGTGEHVDEGIFETDEMSRGHPNTELSSASSSSLWRYSPTLRISTSGSCTGSHGHVAPFASPSDSNKKVQVSPRFQPEPKEAGGLVSGSPDPRLTLPQESPSPSPSCRFSQSTFPQTSPRVITSLEQVHTVGTSSGRPNAWSKPLPGTGLSALPPDPTTQPLSTPHRTHWEAEAERISRVEDLGLRFALEVSLAEAQSRSS